MRTILVNCWDSKGKTNTDTNRILLISIAKTFQLHEIISVILIIGKIVTKVMGYLSKYLT